MRPPTFSTMTMGNVIITERINFRNPSSCMYVCPIVKNESAGFRRDFATNPLVGMSRIQVSGPLLRLALPSTFPLLSGFRSFTRRLPASPPLRSHTITLFAIFSTSLIFCTSPPSQALIVDIALACCARLDQVDCLDSDSGPPPFFQTRQFFASKV